MATRGKKKATTRKKATRKRKIEKREPILMCVCGKKGVGKTYQTKRSLSSYVKGNPKTGAKPRKVLIYDVNMEYTDYKTISAKDVARYSRHPKAEIRRVLPVDPDSGKILHIDQMVDMLNMILENFRGGLLLLEDINRYLIQARSTEVIGAIATNRHRDLDIIAHFQSLAPLDPRMWQNTQVVRFHKQIDDVKRYKARIPNYEMFALAQCLVDYMVLEKNKKRFYCFVSNEDNFIAGDYTKSDFDAACLEYMRRHSKELNDAMKMHDGTKEHKKDAAIKEITSTLTRKYFRGKRG